MPIYRELTLRLEQTPVNTLGRVVSPGSLPTLPRVLLCLSGKPATLPRVPYSSLGDYPAQCTPPAPGTPPCPVYTSCSWSRLPAKSTPPAPGPGYPCPEWYSCSCAGNAARVVLLLLCG